MTKYKHLVLGGTFDHLHLGHKKIIDEAFKQATKVSIGITSGPLIQDKYLSKIIEPYEKRKEAVRDYLKIKGLLNRADLLLITDIYGTTLTDNTIDAILVTRETKPNAYKINLKRKEQRLKPLKIVTIDYIKGPDHKTISSKRIRAGQINKEGLSYLTIFKEKKEFVLPENLKNNLRKPIGKVITGPLNELIVTAKRVIKKISQLSPFMTVSVGDIATSSLIKSGFVPDIQIVDFKSRKKRIKKEVFIPPQTVITKKIINKPGTLNEKNARIYLRIVNDYLETNKKQRLVILGEEDLMALIAILLSPLNSIIVYGQYDLGVVIVFVTAKAKQKALKLLSLFKFFHNNKPEIFK